MKLVLITTLVTFALIAGFGLLAWIFIHWPIVMLMLLALAVFMGVWVGVLNILEDYF